MLTFNATYILFNIFRRAPPLLHIHCDIYRQCHHFNTKVARIRGGENDISLDD